MHCSFANKFKDQFEKMATGDMTIGVTTAVQCVNSVWVKCSQRFYRESDGET